MEGRFCAEETDACRKQRGPEADEGRDGTRFTPMFPTNIHLQDDDIPLVLPSLSHLSLLASGNPKQGLLGAGASREGALLPHRDQPVQRSPAVEGKRRRVPAHPINQTASSSAHGKKRRHPGLLFVDSALSSKTRATLRREEETTRSTGLFGGHPEPRDQAGFGKGVLCLWLVAGARNTA